MKHVFLTGSTGTIGSALVPRLLSEPATTLHLLVRAQSDAELAHRKVQMQAFWGMSEHDPRLRQVHLLRGDISEPRLGLSEQDWHGLADQTTHIIHCAASVKLNMPMAQAQATAVIPTRTLLSLGRLCAQAGTLAKMEMISTVGVWGRTPGQLPEVRVPWVSEFHNTYEAAKAEAERVIWTEGDGLPITVHRPSMVVGESGSGQVIHFQVFYHLCEFLSGTRTFGVMPTLGSTRLDTVPVDWVADVIHWSSNLSETSGQIFNLCSGPQGAITLERLQLKVREIWRQRGLPVPKLHSVSRRWLERLVPVLGALAGAKARRALRGLPPILAYLAEDQGFSNRPSESRLSAAGLSVPEVDNYLAPVLHFYLDSRAGQPTT